MILRRWCWYTYIIICDLNCLLSFFITSGNAYSPGHLVPSLFGELAYALIVDTSFPNIHRWYELDTEHDFHRIARGFHEAFATGVVCQQGAITLPDTWFRPLFLGLACAPIVETWVLQFAMSLLDFSPWIALRTFSILLYGVGLFNRSQNTTELSWISISKAFICKKKIFY